MKHLERLFLEMLPGYFPGREERIAQQVAVEYGLIERDIAFAGNSKNPMDKRMPIAGYLLAIIKVFEGEQVGYDRTRKFILELAQAFTRPRNRFQAFMKKLAPRLVTSGPVRLFLAYLDRRLRNKSHEDGFRVRVLTRKEDTLGFGYGVDILECGICKLFDRHKAGSYASILCEVDYILPSCRVRLIRTGTIAQGAAKCDFRYERVSS